MKKLSLFFIGLFVAFLLLNSCNGGDKKNNENDTTNSDTSIITKQKVKVDTPIYKFKNPDSNFVYFLTDSGIYYINEFTGCIDTVMLGTNIVSFFVNQKDLIFVVSDSNNLSFYHKKLNEDKSLLVNLNLREIFSKYCENTKVNFDNILYIDIVDYEDDSFYFNIYYRPDYYEEPCLPYCQFVYKNFQIQKVETDQQKTYYSSLQPTAKQQELISNITYSPNLGLKYKNNVLVADTALKDYAFDENCLFFFSPDSSRLLWFDKSLWLIIFPSIVNIDGSGYQAVNMYNTFIWIDKNVLLYSTYGLFLLPPNNEEIVLSKQKVIKFMPLMKNTDKNVTFIYSEVTDFIKYNIL